MKFSSKMVLTFFLALYSFLKHDNKLLRFCVPNFERFLLCLSKLLSLPFSETNVIIMNSFFGNYKHLIPIHLLDV